MSWTIYFLIAAIYTVFDTIREAKQGRKFSPYGNIFNGLFWPLNVIEDALWCIRKLVEK